MPSFSHFEHPKCEDLSRNDCLPHKVCEGDYHEEREAFVSRTGFTLYKVFSAGRAQCVIMRHLSDKGNVRMHKPTYLLKE